MDSLGFGLEGPEENVRRRKSGELGNECDARASLELDATSAGSLTWAQRAMAVLNIAVCGQYTTEDESVIVGRV